MNEEGVIDTDKEKLKRKMLSDFVESKTEVAIDRITGTAKSGALRIIERVPAGVVFDLEIILKSYESDEEAEFLDILLKGLKLLQNDALGGSGSRGSGRIEIHDLKVDGVDKSLDEISL
jgi:CRISPR-associated protein Csm3